MLRSFNMRGTKFAEISERAYLLLWKSNSCQAENFL